MMMTVRDPWSETLSFFLIQFFSGTEHSGIDDLILDVSQASYTNGEYVDAKEWFNIYLESLTQF